ncbi:hypothetical protein [Microbacterium sp. 179-I 3D4 NHS]|uniref:hypothetical protein n=1 Tax=Microbacterium sp. 179-I 3D4 NHS TaxID=3142381 RepID=UPI0039A1FE62
MTTPNTTPAGWYDDGSGRQRWWDGQQWGNFADEVSAPAPTTDGSATSADASTPSDAPVESAPETSAFTAPSYEQNAAPAYAGSAPAPAPYAGGGAPSYPGSGAPAYVGAPYGSEPTAKPKLNLLALVSAIVGAIGFIFACIPGALIVGWILLPIAFVLSIVSLFLKGDKKWLGFVGLGLSILGTIVGFIVFFAVVANSFNEAFGDRDVTVTQPSESSSTDESDEPAEEESTGGDEGSRDNPFPVGSEISSDDWTVVINSVNADGNPVVAEANQFNEPAPAGSHYEIVNYTVTYTGDESGYAAEAMVDAVTSSGNVINSYDAFVSLTDSFGFDELYNGGTATGSVAFLVPDGDTIVLRVTPGILADEVFVKP